MALALLALAGSGRPAAQAAGPAANLSLSLSPWAFSCSGGSLIATVYVTDAAGQPVDNGTVVSFRAENGGVQQAAFTVGGFASVAVSSAGNPVTLIASVGEISSQAYIPAICPPEFHRQFIVAPHLVGRFHCLPHLDDCRRFDDCRWLFDHGFIHDWRCEGLGWKWDGHQWWWDGDDWDGWDWHDDDWDWQGAWHDDDWVWDGHDWVFRGRFPRRIDRVGPHLLPLTAFHLDPGISVKAGAVVCGRQATVSVFVSNRFGTPLPDGTVAVFTTPVGTYTATTSGGFAAVTLPPMSGGSAGIAVTVAGFTESITANCGPLPGPAAQVRVTFAQTAVGCGSQAVVLAHVADAFGKAVRENTRVTFAATLGTIYPEAPAFGGIAQSVFTAAIGQAGTAVISAASSGAAGQAILPVVCP